MTTQENQTRSANSERFESTESSHESSTGARGSGHYRGNRRTFLQGVGIVGMISLSGCTVDENGIRWGDEDGATDTPVDEPTDTPVGEPANTPVDEPTDTPDDEPTEEDDEIDLSDYEDGCFSGGTPHVSNGVRDGVEITVTPAGINEDIQLLRETIQFDYEEDYILRDDIDLKRIDEDDEDEDEDDPLVVEAEIIEIEEEDEEENNTIVYEAEIIEIEEEDEEDDDE